MTSLANVIVWGCQLLKLILCIAGITVRVVIVILPWPSSFSSASFLEKKIFLRGYKSWQSALLKLLKVALSNNIGNGLKLVVQKSLKI